jgi:predicted DNA-binding transcriptional regulator YafY
MALDRIVEIKEIKGKYQKNNEIDWNEYFEDIIGVTKPIDEKLQMIKLHFYGKTGKYMESKPIHGSQKSKWVDEKTLEVNLDLIINYELERLILSYADDVKVLQPKTLVNIIEKRLTEAGKLY